MVNFKNLLFFLSITSVFVSFNLYAADPSICSSGVSVAVYENGSLKSCVLKDDYEVNNVQCRYENRIRFYDNGNLESCILSVPATIGEYQCEQYAFITFYPDGRLKSCIKPVQ